MEARGNVYSAVACHRNYGGKIVTIMVVDVMSDYCRKYYDSRGITRMEMVAVV